MAGHKQDDPSYFADLIAEAIRRGMKQLGWSGRELARRLGKSEPYVRERLNGKYEFTLADVENFALFLGVNPEDFVASIDRDVLDASLPKRAGKPLEAVPLADVITGGRRRTAGSSVGGDQEDDFAGEDYDIDLGEITKKDVDLAAMRGRKKADQEAAD